MSVPFLVPQVSCPLDPAEPRQDTDEVKDHWWRQEVVRLEPTRVPPLPSERNKSEYTHTHRSCTSHIPLTPANKSSSKVVQNLQLRQ
eukprot:3315484-Amphidinium_carterae.1